MLYSVRNGKHMRTLEEEKEEMYEEEGHECHSKPVEMPGDSSSDYGEGEVEDSKQIRAASNGYDFTYFSQPPQKQNKEEKM